MTTQAVMHRGILTGGGAGGQSLLAQHQQNHHQHQHGITDVIRSRDTSPEKSVSMGRSLISRTHSLDNIKEGQQGQNKKQVLSADGAKTKARNAKKSRTANLYGEGMLPPIDGRQYSFVRERTFLNGKQGLGGAWGTPGSVQQIQEQHRNPRPRPVREDVSKRIVHHLRKQFLKRLDRRFDDFYDEDEMYEEVENIKAELGNDNKHHTWHQTHTGDHGQWKYKNEREDDRIVDMPLSRRITPIQSTSRPASKGEVRFHNSSTPTNKSALDKLSVSIARPSRDNESLLFPDIDRYSMADENSSPERRASPSKRIDSRQGLRSREPNLPSIQDEGGKSHFDGSMALSEADDSIEGTGNLITKGGIEYLSHSAKKNRVFDMTGLETRENTEYIKTTDDDVFEGDLTKLLNKMADRKPNINFKDLVVSPVATPYIFSRPQTTRTARKMSEMERLMKVIKGQVHVKIKPKSRLQKIYIHSCGIDTETERSYLIQNIYPELRHQYKLKGYDLEIIDLLWGVDGMVIDDHNWLEMAYRMIQSCHSNNKGLSALTFVGQKYGQPTLPSTLTTEEFEAIILEMETHYNSIIQTLEAKVLYVPERSSTRGGTNTKQGTTPSKQGTPALSKQGTLSLSNSRNDKNKQTSAASKESTAGVRTSTVFSPESVNQDDDPQQVEEDAAAKEREEFIKKMQQVKEGIYSLRLLANEHGMTFEEDQFPDIKFVKSWYTLDKNVVPPVYALNSVSSHHPDLKAKDRQHRHEAEKIWKHTSKRLLSLLRHYAERAQCNNYTMSKFMDSDMESQLVDGIFEERCFNPTSCLWIQRELLDIHGSLDDGKVRDYLDLNDFGKAVDQTAQLNLKRLISVLQHRISPTSSMRYTIQWNSQGVCPEKVRTHSTYIDHLGKDIYNRIITKLDQGTEDDQDKLIEHVKVTPEVVNEVQSHSTFCQSRAYSFYGRKDILNSIKKYVRSSCSHPLVVYGKPGSGKTALLAKAAVDIHKWLKEVTIAIVQRSIGVTVSSVNVRLLLRMISLQISHIYDQDTTAVPQDYKSLSNQFYERLSLATEKKPLVLFIDSLHLLTNEHDARKLAWLPKELPPNVKVVLSTDPDEQYDCLPQLQRTLPKGDELYLEIKAVSERDANVILNEWFHRSYRVISSQQHTIIMDYFKKCPHPLYLKMLYTEASKWSSSFDAQSLKLAPAIKTMTTILYANLEKKNGEPLVRRALGYIAATKNGIASSEMEDVLSLDDSVMSDVALHCKLQRRRIPPLFWIRLKEDLKEFIEESSCDNTVTYRFKHSQFHTAAVDRYLNSKDKAPSYHRVLAEYFLNEWFEKPKTYPGNDLGIQRHIMTQELYTEIGGSDNNEREDTDSVDSCTGDSTQVKERRYNLRRLSELPYHLLRSAQSDILKKACLCNFEFAWGKISACSLRAFFEDIQMALSVEPNDKDLHLLSDTLFLAQNILNIDSTQFPSQMVGRLFEIITKDLPVAPQDPVDFPYLKPFLKGARNPSIASIIPSTTCLTPPGGIMFDLLSGHTEEITAVVITTDNQYVITASNDNTVKIWEMRTGRVTKTLVGVGKDVKQIRIGLEGKVVITTEIDCIRIWDRKTGACITKFKTDDPSSVAVTGDTKTIAAFTHGTNTMISWDLETLKVLVNENVNETGKSNIHQDESIVVAMQGIGPMVMYAFRSYYEAVVRNAKTGAVVYTLKCKDGASIQGVACTSQYFICAARYRYQKVYEVFYLEVFDASNGKLLRSVRGCIDDDIRELVINQQGSHAIAICSSESSQTSNIAVWNIETQDHKHIAAHAKVTAFCACSDLRNCITATKSENSVREWNLQSLVNKAPPKAKYSEGVLGFIPVKSNDTQIYAKSTTIGNLSLWDVVNGKCIDKSIKIGGLQEQDVILMDDTRAVILSDKTAVSDDSNNAVYQSLLIYDLKKKEFVRQVKDCFIFQCPEHEYVLLDENHIMGLSEARSHFVVWSLINGQLVYRIKTNFRGKFKEQISPTLPRKARNHTAKMLPWERRLETQTAKQRRRNADIEEHKERIDNLRKEKENAIDQFIISEDHSIIIASFYAHHVCVFDVHKREHIQTLENYDSMMLLYISALTPDGNYFVHANYDDDNKFSYLTLWHTRSGEIIRRIRNEKDVCAVAINDTGTQVVFGKSNKELRVWEPHNRYQPIRRIRGYDSLNFDVGSRIYITENGTRAVVFSGDISLWDLEKAVLLSVFTPDSKIQCFDLRMNGQIIVFGLKDSFDVITLKVRSKDKLDPAIVGEEESDDEEDEKKASDDDD